MRLLFTVCAAVIAIAFVGPQAQADVIWYGGHTHTTLFTPTGGYSYAPAKYFIGAPGYRRSLVWHDTTHVDVIPGRWIHGPVGTVYVPSRRVLHVEGHYDLVPSYPVHHHHPHIH